MSSVPISTAYVERIRKSAAANGNKRGSFKQREVAGMEDNRRATKPHFNHYLADAQMKWKATTKKLFSFMT